MSAMKKMNRFNLLEEDDSNVYQVPVMKNSSNDIRKDNIINTNSKKLEDDIYVPSSLKLKLENNNIKNKDNKSSLKDLNNFPSLKDPKNFPSLSNNVGNTNSTESVSWGDKGKLSVIKYELNLTPVLRNKDLRDDISMIKCYYGDCCKLMSRDIAKYHNKYGVNFYDRKLDCYYYIETDEGNLSYSSPSKFKDLIDEMETDGLEPYFGEEYNEEDNY